MNNAEKIFEGVCHNKYKEIEAYVAPPGREEDLHIDFKEKENPKIPDLSESNKKNYSIALSGFANSDGGVLIWGITCRKINNTDTASELKPITGIRQFISNLNSLTGQAVTPIVEGVVHEEILEPGKSDCGYVATLIPASDAGPQRAEIKGTNKWYYKRSGDSFYSMEHYDLEDMFGRRKKPKLSLNIQLSNADSVRAGVLPSGQLKLELTISISNTGRGIAKYPFLYLKLPDLRLPKPYHVSQYGIDGNRNHGLPLSPGSNMMGPKFCGGANNVIHQGVTLGVTKAEAEIFPEPIYDFNAEYELGAEDIMTTKGTFVIKAEEIKNFLRGKGLI